MSGCVDHCTEPEIDDISFVGVVQRRRRGRLRPVGRRRPVDQPDVRPADRRLRPARPGHRRLGRLHVDLPRLRLPPAAQPRPHQVPDGRLGPGEVPPGAAGRVPARSRCPTARPPRRPSTTSATTSASRKQKDGANAVGFALRTGRISGSAAHPDRRPGRRVRRRAASGRRRSRRWSSSTSPTRRSRTWSPRWPSTTCWCARAPSAAARWPAPAWSSASSRSSRPSSTPRTSTRELEKRLPDFDEPIGINVNGCPNSCARFQTADIGFKGSMVRDDERRDGRGLPGAPGRPPRRRGHLRPQVPRPQGDQGRDGRLLRARAARLPRAPRPTASASPPTWPAPTRSGCCDASDDAAGRTRQLPPFHCPYCGDEDLTPHGESATAGAAAPACGPSPSA